MTDDRLAEIVRHLSLPAIWHPLEQAVSQQIIRVYRLKPERVRLQQMRDRPQAQPKRRSATPAVGERSVSITLM